MANAWMSHLNNTRRKNPGMNLSQAMKKASKTYKKKRNQRGGQVKGGEHKPHRRGTPQQQGPHEHEDAAHVDKVAEKEHTHPKDKNDSHTHISNVSVGVPNKTEGKSNESEKGANNAEKGANNAKKGPPDDLPEKKVEAEGVEGREIFSTRLSGQSGGRRRRRKSRRRRRRQRGGVQGDFGAAERAAHGLHGGRRRRRRSRRRRRQRGGFTSEGEDGPPGGRRRRWRRRRRRRRRRR